MTFILSVIGVVLIIEGIPYFAFPARTRHWAEMMRDVSQRTLRIAGGVAMLVGLLLLFAARNF